MATSMPLKPHSTQIGERRCARRLTTRIRVDFCPLVVQTAGLRVGEPQRGLALSLSRTGAFITDVGYLPLGVTVHLFLRLPDVPANPIGCYAKVVRAEGDGYGVRFVRLDETQAARIERFVLTLRAHRV